jgi:hypothetical protein
MTSPKPAFLVARAIRGTAHTFHVYFEPRRIVFIRVGLGPGVDYVFAAQGGLIGGLLMWWVSSNRKKRQQRRIEENQTRSLDEMLTDHRINHAIAMNDISDVSLEPVGWMLAKGTVNWRFQLRGEKKHALCTFRRIEDIQAAIDLLPTFFPETRIEVQLDGKSGKYLRTKP